VQAVVAASTEPGLVEVFVLSRGRLVAHEGFEAGDLSGLSTFAEGVLARCEEEPDGQRAEAGVAATPASDEARVVAAYLRRRSAAIEAVRLEEARDLLEVARRVAGAKEEGGNPLS
jgi:DNA polymerase-3 subunit epsilon